MALRLTPIQSLRVSRLAVKRLGTAGLLNACARSNSAQREKRCRADRGQLGQHESTRPWVGMLSFSGLRDSDLRRSILT